jgi:triacylglycerol lipase
MQAAEAPRRGWRRRLATASAALVLGYGIACACGLPPSMPFDVAWNLGDFPLDESLRADQDGQRRVVVLQHGLWRSPWALWRLERALVAHGYEVVNPGYASTSTTIDAAAETLAGEVGRAHAASIYGAKIAFVGHSMGGLVCQEAMRRLPTLTPFACVYVAVPHRGAALCDLRKRWWVFPWVMGDGAAMQLSPGDALHRRPIPHVGQSGAILGDLGDGNPSIDGHDDGTVGVAEAALAGAADQVTLPLGHTRIASADETIRQVLMFLKAGRFAR